MDQSTHYSRPSFSSEGESTGINVGQSERLVSLLGGGLLTWYGLSRRSTGGMALAILGGGLLYRGATGHCTAYATMGIDTNGEKGAPLHITETITIERPRGEIYDFWRDLENIPTFMRYVETVRVEDDRRVTWTARVPGDLGTLTWETEITDDRPGERIAWHTLPGSDIEESGAVSFEDAPGERGTVVRLELDYRPPGMGRLAGKLLNPLFSQMLREDIRRFKSLMETGEVPTIEGQPSGH